MFEHIEVFQRLVMGLSSEKKCDFEDKGGRQIALRPEQTASIVRSYAENAHLYMESRYAGPNFRYERAEEDTQLIK